MAGSPLRIRLRNRTERLRQRRWRLAAHASLEAHIIMGGAPRSGTTLLRTLLDRHPEVRSGPETKLFVPAAFNLAWLSEAYAIPRGELEAMRERASSQGAFIDAFAAQACADAGKVRWAEKTPQNIRYLDWIMERFPKASVLHIIRDGRDVICSMREHPDWRWVDGAWQKVLVERPLEWYAQRWLDDTAAGMAWRDDPRYLEVRYEDLVAGPVAALRAICLGLGASADADWLADVTVGQAAVPGRPEYGGAVTAASVGRWRSDLAADERRIVERRCGSRLLELGYEV